MRYTIENERIKIEVSELGATLTRFIDKKSGRDLVLGFDSDEEYVKCGANIGASIGRNANRIADGKFELNGISYTLAQNNGPNNLHGGGMNGFGFRMWSLKEKKEDELVFVYHSLDKEEGFPGNMEVEVSYRLNQNTLTFQYSGKSDQDTVFNMTNHSYFNLGDCNILNQQLHICSDKYSPTDENALTLDEVKDVKGTYYDFTSFDSIGKIQNLPTAIDNNYVFEWMGEKLMIEYQNEEVGLKVYSDLPDIHIYTSFFLGECLGKDNKQYGKYSGICFEAQYFPNAVNYKHYISPILKANESRSHFIRYEIV